MTRSFPVQIEPQGWHFEAAADQTLLLAALAAGVRLPSSCRNGSCRACLCQLLEGEIAYRVEWPGLSREEKAAGCVLPCVAEARSALRLAQPRAEALPGRPPAAAITASSARSAPAPGSASDR